MASRLAGELLRLGLPIEEKSKQMARSRIRSAGDHDRTIGIVHVEKFFELEIGGSDGTDECAVRGMKLHLPGAVALGRPEKFPAVFERDHSLGQLEAVL